MDKNWDLLGHEWAVEMLKQHLTRDSVRHAYLVTGPPGLGRRTLALRFAQALNCTNPPAPGDPCGKCRTCRQIERKQYTDLLIVQAEKEGGTLKVEQIRSLRQTLSLKPYQGKYRVSLLLRFQEANPSSSNALLKTLEETADHDVLILTADNAEQLLPTIVSRCETLRLRPLPVDAVEAYLKERDMDDSTASLLAHISGGRPGYALRLMGDKEALKSRADRLDEIQKLLRSTRTVRFAYAEKLTDRKHASGEPFRETLVLWLSFWRDVLLRLSGSKSALTNVDYSDSIDYLASTLTQAGATKLVRDAEGAIEKLERNVNARLLAEVVLLDWPKIA